FSLAILPDGQSFLLGTRWRLRYFDKQGREIWNVQPPEQVWAANVARQGKLGILALGDGTIRWYRLSDGEELLAFFPHRDGKRWVAWTPSGYYMASAGGDTLIGWHVNRGKDRAGDFFSVSRFRDDLYRPDVVGKVLAFLDEGKALAAANQTADRRVPQRGIADILPPVVAVEGGSAVADGRLTLNYSIRSASGEPAKGLRVLADGRPIAELTGDIEAKQDGTQHRLDVALPENTRGISLVAKNRHGIYSEPAMLALDYAEGGGAKPQPKLYLLAIGVSDYANPELKLKYAGRDARDFSDKASLQKGGLYRSVETRVLTDGEASLENVLEGLAWIQKTPQSGDVAMIFLAGHGVDDSGGNYFFLPHGTDLDRLPETAVPYERIRSTLASIPARTFLFVDTCHAAGVWGQAKSAPVDINRVVNDLASPEYGVVVFASSANEQLSLESDVWQNGAFTEALLEGIDGEATYRDKPYITVSMLDVYLSERVYELTRGRQTPTTRRPLNVPSGFRIVLPASLLESLGR
ncbi:MAG: caspase family protein, partial [Alphaproteobacteria bacterium]